MATKQVFIPHLPVHYPVTFLISKSPIFGGSRFFMQNLQIYFSCTTWISQYMIEPQLKIATVWKHPVKRLLLVLYISWCLNLVFLMSWIALLQNWDLSSMHTTYDPLLVRKARINTLHNYSMFFMYSAFITHQRNGREAKRLQNSRE